nr:uncharacterized protein LOC111136210 isoform X2 [Crassostrea virginica]
MFMAYVITGVGNLGMTLVYSMIRWPSLLQTLQDYYMVYTTSLSSGTVWLCIVVLAVIALLPDLLIRVHRDTTNRIAESTNRRESEVVVEDEFESPDKPLSSQERVLFGTLVFFMYAIFIVAVSLTAHYNQ